MAPPLRDDGGTSSTSFSSPRPLSSPSLEASLPASSRLPPPLPSVSSGPAKVDLSFSHIHAYADAVSDLEEYKRWEEALNRLLSSRNHVGRSRLDERGGELDVGGLSGVWDKQCSDGEAGRVPTSAFGDGKDIFSPQNRDLVLQLVAGLGFRVTGLRDSKNIGGGSEIRTNTRSFLVTTRDPSGVQILVTAVDENVEGIKDEYLHFEATNVRRFLSHHRGYQGIAVLAFEVISGSINDIHRSYKEMHPKLIPAEYAKGPRAYKISEIDSHDITEVLEIYAYYKGEKLISDADLGTRLRFVQRKGGKNEKGCVLPGIKAVKAEFDTISQAAYCDHWVSNVVSRTGFLDTLEDTLGFVPKVDFNAGVVAAGEAQIESTVTGNNSKFLTTEREQALRDQSQVYLPINNALSEVGHVHGFLKEIGQGIQHVASRVDDLPLFVQNGNDMRCITGEGFTFLRIPRSYYGVLTKEMLIQGAPDRKSGEYSSSLLSPPCAACILYLLIGSGLSSPEGAIALSCSREDAESVLDKNIPAEHKKEFESKKKHVLNVIFHSVYTNLYNLLGDRLTEKEYRAIVRNMILVDVQGQDLLLQIFTCNILQREPGQEAPFLEFIQRVCGNGQGSKKHGNNHQMPLKPGCGGFGIRNFLTLFLSIEVSKAMLEASQAKEIGDDDKYFIAQAMVKVFTDQLNESNPILTHISDAMTEEGEAESYMEGAQARGDEGGIKKWKERMLEAARRKDDGNARLMACSARYNARMKALREGSNK